MIVSEKLEQGSDAWFKIRQGRPTASEFSRIITAKTGAPSASREDYIDELIAESYIPEQDAVENSWVFTGQKFIGNKFTDHGNDFEPEAREAFAKEMETEVAEVGFITRDDGIVGCSPDGLLADEAGDWWAGVEIKCKCLKNHIKAKRTGALPDEHKAQVHGSMAVTGLRVWFFVSYFPGRPVHIVRVEWDSYTDKVSAALDQFLIDYAARREADFKTK